MTKHAAAVTEVRPFLEAISSGTAAPNRVPPVLRELARRALPPGQRHGAAVDDLVGDLLLHIAEATAAGNARSAVQLLPLDDAGLLAALRRRLHQLAAESSPRWSLVKSLRSHVSAALQEPLPAVDAFPLGLVRGDRLSRALVTEAVAVLLGEQPDLRGDVAAVASELTARYFPDALALDLAPEMVSDRREDAEAGLDARAVATIVVDIVGETRAHALAERARGLSLVSIASRCGHAPSSVHAWLGEAVGQVRAHRQDFDAGSFMEAMTLLKEVA